MYNLSCHIIGMNPFTKKEFIQRLNNKTFNVIDLDTINNLILKDPEMDKMFNQFQKLKEDKNDKFKEVDKKMSQFWEKNFIERVEDKIKQSKTNILIGMNNHYKGLTKRVPILCTNKFIIKSDPEKEVQEWIRFNLENYKDDIIMGKFPLEYIQYDILLKKRMNIENTYKKIGYIEKTLDQINIILDLIEKSKNTVYDDLWISMKEPYNVGSLIHPKDKMNPKIYGFTDPNVALLSSINFDSDMVKMKTHDMGITIKEVKEKGLNKLKTKRFLYLVEPNTFMPDDSGHNHKFFSQLPVKIITKEKIDSVYKYFIEEKK